MIFFSRTSSMFFDSSTFLGPYAYISRELILGSMEYKSRVAFRNEFNCREEGFTTPTPVSGFSLDLT